MGSPSDEELAARARAMLTGRELAVHLAGEGGMSQRAIAAWLGIARSTVRDHQEQARRKLARAV